MLEIVQFRYHSDNLAYLVYGEGGEAMAIDGGAVDDILAYVDHHKLALKIVTNTHSHADHTVGNEALLQKSRAAFMSCPQSVKQGNIELAGESIQVIATPGHTEDSLVFQTSGALICGDTLFNGTVGNCFSGDLEAFLDSIQKLMAFAPETIVYAGHDYVKYAMAFARIVEPDNPGIKAYLSSYNPEKVYSTLAQELKVNPYLRFNAPEMVKRLKEKNLPVKTELERWKAVMSLG